MRACLLEGRERFVYCGDHPWTDREDAVVARIGDLLARNGTAERGDEVHAAVNGIWVARIVAGEHRHRQGGILDGARNRALEYERRGAAEGVRPRHQRHAPERGLVSVYAA